MTDNKCTFGIQSFCSKTINADNLKPVLIDSGAAIGVICADVFGIFNNSSHLFTLEASDIQASTINGCRLQFKGVYLLHVVGSEMNPVFRFFSEYFRFKLFV